MSIETDWVREYRPPVKGLGVFFHAELIPRQNRRYLQGIAENVSLGGMFVATAHPLAPGTILRLQLFDPDEPPHASPLRARAVVRWRRVWREPRGMGIQFVEFAGLGVLPARALTPGSALHHQLVAPAGAPPQPGPGSS
ncbi:MAG TPA: PilZ domain-containing protein [Thermoanaerobaculia bacterium]|nr:PilZ domain-containing protein [Thermoanaerobaculia bacterium]